MQVAARQFNAGVAVEWVDAEPGDAARRLCREGIVPVEERELLIEQDARAVTKEELRLRERLHRVMEPPCDVHVRGRHRPELRDGRDGEVELLVAEHVRERDLCAAEQIAPARQPDVHRRPTFQEQFLERALFPDVAPEQCMDEWWLEVDDRPGDAELRGRDRVQRLLARERVHPVLPLVIGYERDARNLLVPEHHRGDIGRERVRELPELAVLQVERPDVVDVPVAGDLGIGRLVRIRGRGREDDRARVHELRSAVVVRAEGDLRFCPAREIQAEELVGAADPGEVDE